MPDPLFAPAARCVRRETTCMRAQAGPSCRRQNVCLQVCCKAVKHVRADNLHASLIQHPAKAVRHQAAQFSRLSTCCISAGFHQQRLAAKARTTPKNTAQPRTLQIREAETDAELKAIGWLRAQSFYAYPPERAFAGEIHQAMIADEEYKALKSEHLRRAELITEHQAMDRSACLLARGDPCDGLPEDEAILGTLDLYAVKAVQGEVLIGNSDNAAYLANVCVAEGARRQGVGGALIQAARQYARTWDVVRHTSAPDIASPQKGGASTQSSSHAVPSSSVRSPNRGASVWKTGVNALYVHIMAVNEGAKLFYQLHGFVTEQEESSNQAHYRGHCLDGVEGRGRTMLLRDTLL